MNAFVPQSLTNLLRNSPTNVFIVCLTVSKITRLDLSLCDEKCFYAKYVYVWCVLSLSPTQPDSQETEYMSKLLKYIYVHNFYVKLRFCERKNYFLCHIFRRFSFSVHFSVCIFFVCLFDRSPISLFVKYFASEDSLSFSLYKNIKC